MLFDTFKLALIADWKKQIKSNFFQNIPRLQKYASKQCDCSIFLLFTKLETAEFSPLLVTVIFIGNYTSRDLVMQLVTDKKWVQ